MMSTQMKQGSAQEGMQALCWGMPALWTEAFCGVYSLLGLACELDWIRLQCWETGSGPSMPALRNKGCCDLCPSFSAGSQADVDEALRLMRMSKYSLYDDSDRRQGPADPIGEIYTRIRDDYLRTRKSVYTWPELQHLCGIGFSVRLYLLLGGCRACQAVAI